MNNVSCKVINHAIRSMMKEPSFEARLTKIIDSLEDSGEILNALADGIPVEVKEYDREKLNKHFYKKEVIDIIPGPLKSVVKYKTLATKYFKYQNDADDFTKRGWDCSADGKYSQQGEYIYEGIWPYESEESVLNSTLESYGVVFKRR